MKNKIRTALRNASLPLRVEIIRSDRLPTFIFDGAHNRASMHALIKTVTEIYPNHRRFLIFGASLGKDIAGMFAEIEGHFEHVFLTQSSHTSRRFPPQELRKLLSLPDSKVSVVEKGKDALEQCVKGANQEDVIAVTGSLYLAAELRKCF